MKRSLSWAFLLGSMAVPSAEARICALDSPPAATLLLPYFEVDVGGASGKTTLLSINNAAAEAHLAHVVLWTDIAVPTLAFDVYLTGYDVQTINLRDVFNGVLPSTADAGRDPGDTISPKGAFSQDIELPGCAGSLPPAALSAAQAQSLRRAHTGFALPEDPTHCVGLPTGDGIARGYVTVDVVTRCSALTPRDPGYFGADGVAGNANVLWGDYYYVQAGNTAFAQAQNLVRLETSSTLAGQRTFYAHDVGFTGADEREPLPTTWAVRYLSGGGFQGATDLIIWRDPRTPGAPFLCGGTPAGYPADENAIVVFDEQENAAVPSQCFPPNPCGLPLPRLGASSRLAVGGTEFPVPYQFGWLFLDLNLPPAPVDPFDPVDASWVGTVMSSQGLFSVGLAGTPLDNGCSPSPGSLVPVR